MCERHDVNPEAYLTDVLLRIQDQPKSRLAELLPHRCKETFGSGFAVERVVTPSGATWPVAGGSTTRVTTPPGFIPTAARAPPSADSTVAYDAAFA